MLIRGVSYVHASYRFMHMCRYNAGIIHINNTISICNSILYIHENTCCTYQETNDPTFLYMWLPCNTKGQCQDMNFFKRWKKWILNQIIRYLMFEEKKIKKNYFHQKNPHYIALPQIWKKTTTKGATLNITSPTAKNFFPSLA